MSPSVSNTGVSNTGVNLAEELAAWSQTVSWHSASASDQQIVLNSLVDTIGVSLAALDLPELPTVLRFARALGTGGTCAPVWGTDEHLPIGSAALANGTIGHLLDYDDIQYRIHGHPSTVLLPALLAVGQARGLPGAPLLTGYIAGIGAMTALSHMFGPEHYTRGWHSTATQGTVGAALAVATMLDLGHQERVSAINAALSMSSGIRANFGTVMKPLHAGLAARSGVEAVLLVESGTLIETDALGDRFGAIDVFGDGSWAAADDDRLAVALADADRAVVQIGLKPYPCCTGGHWAIEAALEVRAALGDPEPGDLASVTVQVPLGARIALIYDDPKTGLEGKFSLPYAVATSLGRGLPAPRHFTDEAVTADDVRHLMAKVTVVEDTSLGDLSATAVGRYADITATTNDGRAGQARVTTPKGSWTRPMSAADVDAKFMGCVDGLLTPTQAQLLIDRLRNTAEEPSVTDILR